MSTLTVLVLPIAVALWLPALAFLLYPAVLLALSRFAPVDDDARGSPAVASAASDEASASEGLSIALVTVCNRCDAKLDRKLAEFAALAERQPQVEIFAGLDGDLPPESTDASVTWIPVNPPQGKNVVLQRVRDAARADVLVFSDVDARVEPGSLDTLLRHFEKGDVGAVTGRRAIVDDTRFGSGQASYGDLDSRIRTLEMKCFGSVTSCDGKLYAIRRSLAGALPQDVTDDLYTGLGAVLAGSRLVSEPEAVATIGRPARDMRHELERRRRVTVRGLATLWHRRALLDPRRYGRYAAALFTNKVLRRVAAPCALLGTLVLLPLVLFASATGATTFPATTFLAYAAAAAVALLAVACALGRGAAVAYLSLGTLGMTLGVFDYALGKRVRMWEPRKQDTEEQGEGETGRPTVMYLVSHYPKLTETFIVDEIRELERHCDVSVHPIVAARPAAGHDPRSSFEHRVIREQAFSWRILRDAGRETLRSPRSLCWCVAVIARRTTSHPGVAVKTLAMVPKTLALVHRLRERPVQLVHAGFASYAGTMAWMVSRLSGVPFSFVAHANDIFKTSFLLDEKVRDAAAVISISHYNKDYLLRASPRATSERIHVVPTGVDSGQLVYRRRQPVGQEFDLLSIGSLLEKKGHAVLIEAMAALRTSGHRVRCRIVGEGPERRALERQIEQLGLGEAVELLGPQSRERVRELLAGADAFVLACREARDKSADGIPVALMEAMACGVPVVSTRLMAIPELIVDGSSGLLCEPDSVQGIAGCVARLIEDGALRDALAVAARARVESDFDQTRISPVRSSIVADAIAAHPAPTGRPPAAESAALIERGGVPVKVAFVIQTYHPVVGGSERQLQKVLPALQGQGIDPLVITSGLRGVPHSELVDGVRVVRHGSTRFGKAGKLVFLLRALWTLRRHDPDVVHAFSLMTPATIGAFHRLTGGCPMVVKALRGGTRGDLDRIRHKGFYRLRCRLLRRTIGAAQVISEEIDDEFAAIGIPRERRKRISNGVDVSALRAGGDGERLRRSLGVAADDPLFVYVGRLVPEKRVDLLVDAFRAVQARFPLARLLIVGNGPERRWLDEVADTDDGIIAFGQTDDVPDVLAAATVFVQPSSTEGMSNSLLEAMAVGLSIVATDVGGASELLGDSDRGWLVPPNDALALQRAMLAALDESAGARGARARRFVERHYDLRNTADELVRVYRSLVPDVTTGADVVARPVR